MNPNVLRPSPNESGLEHLRTPMFQMLPRVFILWGELTLARLAPLGAVPTVAKKTDRLNNSHQPASLGSPEP